MRYKEQHKKGYKDKHKRGNIEQRRILLDNVWIDITENYTI